MIALVLIALVLGSAAPVWPLLDRIGELETQLKRSVIAFTVSEALLLFFLGSQVVHLLTLDYSTKFAVVGLPCCVLAFALACTRASRGSGSDAVAVGSALNFVLWIFVCTVH